MNPQGERAGARADAIVVLNAGSSSIKFSLFVTRGGELTAIETNGCLGEQLRDEELDQIDLVLLGIKTWDPERHRNLTGKPIGLTLTFARRLAARKHSVWVRFVLVPGLTDDQMDVALIADLAARLGQVERVEVLPFHQMGRYKWDKLGLDYSLKDTQSLTAF